jgi:two-component system chemotaxis response regulator CheB
MRSEGQHPRSAFLVPHSAYRAVVMGASAGGREALAEILSRLPEDYALPILIVQHLHPGDDGGFANHLTRAIRRVVVVPCDKEEIVAGRVYVAPANYHMLVERNGTIALSVDERVNWSRPAIDVLFDSAAHVWGKLLIAVILSGASSDGAQGMRTVKAMGGLCVAQDPRTAEHPVMPQAAIDAGAVDRLMTPEEIGKLLVEVGAPNAERGTRNLELGRLPFEIDKGH